MGDLILHLDKPDMVRLPYIAISLSQAPAAVEHALHYAKHDRIPATTFAPLLDYRLSRK